MSPGVRLPQPALAAVLALLTVHGSAALAAGPERVARPSIGSTAIEWQPLVEHERLVLTVSLPDGRVIRREVAAGECPAWSLFDRAGQPLPDGTYAYELTVVPRLSPAARTALARARETGDASALGELRARGQLPAPLIQSGHFTVRGGAFVVPESASPEADEPALDGGLAPAATPGEPGLALRDLVLGDDLILLGHACVGLDCVNGEDFLFDSLRLKENNLRIAFIDTSVGGFPAADWQIRANSVDEGGAGFLAIDYLGTTDANGAQPESTPFMVSAAAPNRSLFVDPTGRIGFGTSTPVLDLHVHSSDTPAVRLEQNGAAGFTPQTWDVAGNEANFFVRDQTAGPHLPFRIRPGAPTSSLDIHVEGVGVFTPDPQDRLHVEVGERKSGGVTIHSANEGVSPRVTLSEPNRTWEVSVSAAGDFLLGDATAGIVPLRVAAGAGTDDRLAIVTDGVEVRGTLRVDGTAMNVPDFVFAPGYEPMPLPELAAFVAENRHLPGIPGAAEVQERGLDLSRFPLQLLAQVEELVLYTLAQDETIRRLEARVAQLEQITPPGGR